MSIAFSKRLILIGATAGLAWTSGVVFSQGPAGAPTPTQQAVPGAGGGRGRGGLPGATPAQLQAVTDMNTALAPLMTAATAARNELATVTFSEPRNDAAIKAAVDKLRAAELALATTRAEAFEKLQAGPHKLNADQLAALIAAGGAPGAGRGGRGGGN